jgi:glucose-1-phosphate cytidylyltransferase
MKAVILAGGFGTRLSEETSSKPKPMVEIDGEPILIHILNLYSHYGINEFIICGGYKFEYIMKYFFDIKKYHSAVEFNLFDDTINITKRNKKDWKVTVVDTGLHTMTGGRLKRIKDYLDEEEDFCMTYGDGLSDINISDSIKFHKEHGGLATLAAVYPPARFGALNILNNSQVESFQEKPKGDGARINGGFFVLSKKVIDYIEGDNTIWEREPLEKLSANKELYAYKHNGFWQPMDTLKDKRELEKLISNNNAPWIK